MPLAAARICPHTNNGSLRLFQPLVQHALDRGYEVVGVCRELSVSKLDTFTGRITVVPGAMNDREVIKKAVAGCDGVLTVLVPWGNQHYSSGKAQAVLDYAQPGARLIFSCGWHITRDGKDVYPPSLIREEKIARWLTRIIPFVDIDDQVEACRLIFASETRWTVVRGSDLEQGESQGVRVWRRHVGDPILASNELEGWIRRGKSLDEIPQVDGWTSPRLGVRFDLSSGDLQVFEPDGQPFATYVELVAQRDSNANGFKRNACWRNRNASGRNAWPPSCGRWA